MDDFGSFRLCRLRSYFSKYAPPECRLMRNDPRDLARAEIDTFLCFSTWVLYQSTDKSFSTIVDYSILIRRKRVEAILGRVQFRKFWFFQQNDAKSSGAPENVCGHFLVDISEQPLRASFEF